MRGWIIEGHDIAESDGFHLGTSRSLTEVSVDRLIETWAQNKQEIYQLFGDNMIIEIPFDGMDVGTNYSLYIDEIEEFRRSVNGMTYYFFECFKHHEIAQNSLSDDITVRETILLKKGIRLTKALKLFLESYELLDMQIEHIMKVVLLEYSKFIQKMRAPRSLYLSIHPFDFFTMSQNKSNWDSCYSIGKEHQAAPLIYMCDKVTVVAYAKTDFDVKYSHLDYLEWNNKTWRQLVHLDLNNNTYATGQPYPFAAKIVTNAIMEYLNKLLGISKPVEVSLDGVAVGRFLSYNTNDICYDEIFKKQSSFFVYDGDKVESEDDCNEIVVGQPIICPLCEEAYIEGANGAVSFFCEYCVPLYYATCEHCSDSIDRSSEAIIGDITLCMSCYDAYYCTCELCGEITHVNDMGPEITDKANDWYYYNLCWHCYGRVDHENLQFDIELDNEKEEDEGA